MEERHYDLIVCGGGPAGAAAALTCKRLAPHKRVLLLEAGTYPRPKVCGEFLSPEAIDLFTDIAAMHGTTLLERAPRIRRVHFHSGKSHASVALRRPALSIARNNLDHALWQAALRARVDCRDRARVQRVTADGDLFHVMIDGSGFSSQGFTSQGFTSQIVVNATGRWSELNSSYAGRTNLIGIKCHYEVPESDGPACNLHFFDGGYLGRQPISETAVCASALVDTSRYRNLDAVFEAAGLERLTRDWEPLMEPLKCPPVRFAAPQPVNHGLLNCGDAAAFIDPFAGDGMSLALHSGTLAGQVAASIVAGRSLPSARAHYEAEYLRLFARAFRSARLLRRFAFASAPWIRSVFISTLNVDFIAQKALAMTRAS